jgi:flagellar hook assembly protein FlgD
MVDVSDLTGRVVRHVYAGADPIGHYEWEWDGRDESGNLVPPGISIYRLEVDADLEKVTDLGIVNVVY